MKGLINNGWFNKEYRWSLSEVEACCFTGAQRSWTKQRDDVLTSGGATSWAVSWPYLILM